MAEYHRLDMKGEVLSSSDKLSDSCWSSDRCEKRVSWPPTGLKRAMVPWCHGQASWVFIARIFWDGKLTPFRGTLMSYTHWKESNSWWWDDHAPFIPCNLDHRTSKQCSCDNRKWLRTLGCFQFEMWSFSGNGRPLNVHNPAAYKSFQHNFLIPSHWGTQTGLLQMVGIWFRARFYDWVGGTPWTNSEQTWTIGWLTLNYSFNLIIDYLG